MALILTYFAIVLLPCLLYNFISTFVGTAWSGLFIFLLCFSYKAKKRHSNGSLAEGFSISRVFIVFGAVTCVLVTGLQYGYITTECYIYECCDQKWISPNITDLSLQLNQKVYGQQLAMVPLVKLLRGHVDGQPQKAIVLSLNGLSGTGKHFVSRIVAESMYMKGLNSKYVHFLSSMKDFPHESHLYDYKDKLRQIIETSVQECPRSFFIFDGMDNLPMGLIDTIQPFVDTKEHADGTDYRKSLYFFLSNTGGDAIAEKVTQNKERRGNRRPVSFKEMEEVVRISSLNYANGLHQSSIVKNSLITAYIPFLPLEREHVKKCIVDGLLAKGFYKFENQVDKDTVEKIADELLYFPSDTRMFSSTGCKRVIEKIDLIMQEEGNND